MQLTNKYGLPKTFVNLLKRPTYTKEGAKLSVTELISPPRIVQLRARFAEKIIEDVADHIAPLLGSAVHHMLEMGKDVHQIVEERLHAHLDNWHISGSVDLQEIHPDLSIDVSDYKVTTVFQASQDKPEWEAQLNIYAWLIDLHKHVPIRSLSIVAILKDWSKTKALQSEEYPPAPVIRIPIALWTQAEQQAYILKRIAKHREAEPLEDGALPKCTSEEMWEKPTAYAVIRKGGKRATKVYEIKNDAVLHAIQAGDNYEVVERPGERIRCQLYCSVAPFCNQYQAYLKEKHVEDICER